MTGRWWSAYDEPAFGGRRGIGGIKTFAFPLSLDDKMGTFNGNPYRPGWSEEMLSGRLLELRQAGFDFIRLNIDPGPLLAADPTGLDRLISEIDFALTSTLAAGLKVVLDIHPSDGHPAWGAEKITSGTSQPVFQRYLGIVRRAARLVDGFDPRRDILAAEPGGLPA